MLLSAPKGVHFLCELCGKAGHLQCPQCRCTYYCSKDHQETDWNGVHVKICPYLHELRGPAKVLGSEEQRAEFAAHRLRMQRDVIEIGKTEATRNLLAQKYSFAIPGALQALRLTTELYGDGGIEIVPPYLLLAQATTGLRKYKQAEEYLSLAKWCVLKNHRCSDSLKSQLYRNFGKLYQSQGKAEESLAHHGHSVYYSSLAVGPEHIDTTPGYFAMGLLFHERHALDSALAMFDKVADTWYKYLSGAPAGKDKEKERDADRERDGKDKEKEKDKDKEKEKEKEKTAEEIEEEAALAAERRKAELPPLDELKGTEAEEMMSKIIAIREQHLGANHTATGEAHYILALVLTRLGKLEKALERMQRSLSVYEDTLGGDHATTVAVRTALSELEADYFRA